VNLSERIEVLRNVVWEVVAYKDFIEYLSYDLHPTPSRIDNNAGVHFIWRSMIRLQIITLNKLIKDNGAFSFHKIINMAGAKVKGFHIDEFQEELDVMINEFKANNLDTVRDKFLAHLDISAEEIKTDIHILSIKANQVVSLFNNIAAKLGFPEYTHDERCINGLNEIFSELDEYELVKAFLMASEIKNKELVSISEIAEAIKG